MSEYTEKLNSLTELKDGCDSYRGKAPTTAAIETARNLTVCPHSNGGLQVEMHAGGADVEIEIGKDGKVISVFFMRVD